MPAEGKFFPAVALSPDGNSLAVGRDAGGRIKEIALYRRTGFALPEQPKLRGHTDFVGGLVFSPDSRRLASSSWDGTLRLWDLSVNPPTQRVVATLPGAATGIGWSPDGKLLVCGCEDGRVRVWNVSGDKPVENANVFAHGDWSSGVSFAPDGATFVTTGGGMRSGKRTAIWWNTADVSKRQEWLLPERSSSCAFAPDGRHLAITCYNHHVYILRLNGR
jgi:WD40 repeat protein